MVLNFSSGVFRHLCCFHFWIFAQHHSCVSKELGFLNKAETYKRAQGRQVPTFSWTEDPCYDHYQSMCLKGDSKEQETEEVPEVFKEKPLQQIYSQEKVTDEGNCALRSGYLCKYGPAEGRPQVCSPLGLVLRASSVHGQQRCQNSGPTVKQACVGQKSPLTWGKGKKQYRSRDLGAVMQNTMRF